MENTKYDVFISYSRKDSTVADRICEAFDKVGITYFIDRQGISGGFEFPTVIAEAIKKSRIFLCLASRNYYKSKFVHSESTFAFNEKLKNSILFYNIDDCTTIPNSLHFVFSSINWRRLDKHSIETVLINDILHILDRKRINALENKRLFVCEKVDLGLSVYWADCNVGANSPEEYGDYFAWGETMPKDTYTEDNCKIGKKYIRYILSLTEYDTARANWGGNWRMPTEMEFNELIDKCAWQWTEQGGKKGYKVISNKNGNSIFLPASGYRNGTLFYEVGYCGNYWSSSACASSSLCACCLEFESNEDYYCVDCLGRYYGLCVRPVSE